MKKNLILVASITVISCQDNVPKCNDPEVLKIVYSVINENKNNMTFDGEIFGILPYGNKKELTSENLEITNLLTKSKDAELSSCGCEGKLTIKNISEENTVLEGLIEYTAQKNTENNIIIKVESLSTLKVVNNEPVVDNQQKDNNITYFTKEEFDNFPPYGRKDFMEHNLEWIEKTRKEDTEKIKKDESLSSTDKAEYLKEIEDDYAKRIEGVKIDGECRFK